MKNKYLLFFLGAINVAQLVYFGDLLFKFTDIIEHIGFMFVVLMVTGLIYSTYRIINEIAK